MQPADVSAFMYLLDQSFDENLEHSLIGNLRTVRDSSWATLPAGGTRTIRQIADHAAVAIHLYGNHLFGDATMTYAGILKASPATDDASSIAAVEAWMREGHMLLRDGVAGLGEADLQRLRRAHWGEMAETRWLLSAVIQHNTYHGGEINHVRALLQDDDEWPWARTSAR